MYDSILNELLALMQAKVAYYREIGQNDKAYVYDETSILLDAVINDNKELVMGAWEGFEAYDSRIHAWSVWGKLESVPKIGELFVYNGVIGKVTEYFVDNYTQTAILKMKVLGKIKGE